MSTVETAVPSVSLVARIACMRAGDCLLEPEKSKWSRNALEKAVREAARFGEDTHYTVTLCYGIQHDAQGTNFRFYKIERTS
ncbi:hypothetical protein IAG25_15640 [Caballeronia sp. EK]|uniref:hypothetical protein n=1 Tax=Caballeronia sp. EK TaxID=2767469 RepID=UPI0016563CA5|nr:hypothetical protein [Caballeronia sp. EK]MBC8638254.1 hypothetical protein [Caballeronia sp. EK]